MHHLTAKLSEKRREESDSRNIRRAGWEGGGGHIGENSRRRFEARKGLDEELKEGDLRINGLIELVAG